MNFRNILTERLDVEFHYLLIYTEIKYPDILDFIIIRNCWGNNSLSNAIIFKYSSLVPFSSVITIHPSKMKYHFCIITC